MNLAKILSKVKVKFEINCDDCDVKIEDIAIDSRLVKSAISTVFFALDGEKTSGEKFISSAIKNGAKIIVTKNFLQQDGIIFIKTQNPFQLLVEFLNEFYNQLPSNIYTVTGTNGKSSVVEFVRQILQFLGKKSATIGTLGISCDKKIKDLVSFDLTTPDIVSLYKNLAILKKNNIDDVAIEVSSIGLKQARIAGLKIDVAAFTNFTQDHLDYHKTMEEYFFSKMLLFEAVMKNGSAAVLNADIAEFANIRKMCEHKKHHIFEYGFKANDLKIIEIKKDGEKQKILLQCAAKNHEIELNFSGEFQVYNVLCALAMVMSKHYLDEEKFSDLLKKFPKLTVALGRMQKIATLTNNAQVFIDFAHSPDALENVLKLASSFDNHRIGVLFGCGGNRDKTKRANMGKVASEFADFIIVTDDNPRNEDAAAIRKDILQGCDMAKTVEIADRKYAIEKSLQMLQVNDILILAGKGHEKYQIIGDVKNEFDEEKIVKEFLRNK